MWTHLLNDKKWLSGGGGVSLPPLIIQDSGHKSYIH